VGIDRPDDADVPSDEHADHPADRADKSADGGGQAGRAPAETRYRQEYHADLRAEVEGQTEPAGRSEPGARSKTGESAENGQQAKSAASWEEMAERARWMWGEYKRRWPPEERPPIDRSEDPPGSWHGEGDRFLDTVENERIEAQCDLIVEREQKRITPALRGIESQNPDRHLVGFRYCRKEPDRIKEKVCDNMKTFIISADEALSLVPDTIRYTFQYEKEARYTRGVLADISHLRDQGFRLEKLTNYWSDDQYKGINSQWIDLDSGQRFEVQFHTRISFEAKQLTHGAYERLRSEQKPDEFEQMVLEAFQKKVSAEVPVPPDAADIPDYPKRGTDAG
jgi:hypothetical protein